MKKSWVILLCVTLLLLLVACSGEMTDVDTTVPPMITELPPTEMNCTVTVLDPAGAPVPDIEIKVYQNGEVCEGKTVDENGKASFILGFGEEYSIVFHSPDEKEYYYDESVSRVNSQQTEVTVVLYEKVSNAEDIRAYGEGKTASQTFGAYLVGEGAYYTPLAENDRTYYIFTPDRPGIYRFSVDGEASVTVGYYGMPIQPLKDNVLALAEDGSLTIEVKERNIGKTLDTTTRYVIGLSAGKGVSDAIFRVEHVGEPVKTPEDEPWIDVLADRELKAYKKKRGTLTDLDIFNPDLTVVFNEQDGYYHLDTVDGPVVLLRLTEKSSYLAAFTTMCDTGRLGSYLYDDEGNFLRKESFNALIAQYAAICDTKYGICPLDAKLAYMLKTLGEAKQWWDFESGNHLFVEEKETVPEDTAWLFACCYLER
jgi:hypothetical protein